MCKYKDIKRSSAAPQRGSGCYPPRRQHPPPPLVPARNFLSGRCPTGTLSAATVHFKDTWESAHIRLWPYITTDPFDVTLPRAATTVNTQAGEKKTFFSPAEENARCLSRWSLEGEKQNNNNKMRLINLDLPTRRSFVCVAGHVCHWWNTATGNICCKKLQNVA